MRYAIITALAIILASSTVTAQSNLPLRAAHQIYESCMGGYFLAANIRPTKEEIKKFIYDAHEQCFTWMVVWYHPVTGYIVKMSEWSDSDLEKLDKMIAKTMRDMDIEMRVYLGVK